MRLILVLHHHQPLGQLPWIVSDAVDQCYAPLLKVLLNHPKIKLALHYSGPLLQMLQADFPEILEQVKVLLERGQIELLGGSWWESILPIWPTEDQLAQLQLSRSRLKVLFDVDAKGAWLPERVWEPALAETLLQSGYDWVLLDEIGLQQAASARDLEQVCQTPQGLKALSINTHLRKLIPWHDVDEVMDYLAAVHQDNPQATLVFADDAEKFGSWPGTFELIYEEQYLHDLLTAFENASWLHTELPTRSVAGSTHAVLQIPPCSYPEMLEWSAGNWRNFLSRYQESRDLYDAVIRAPRNETTLPMLLAGQCNDVYWHGVFGGLYLPHLRQAAWGKIAAASAIRPQEGFQRTGSGDIIFNDLHQMLGWRAHGGQLFLWIDFHTKHHWLATLRHYKETYIENSPADWYARGGGIEHFLGAGASPDSIVNGQMPEEGDFASELWQMEVPQEQAAEISLTRHGGVWQNGVFEPLEIQKKILLSDQNSWQLQYEFTNPGAQTLQLWWGSEWNFTASGNAWPDRYLQVGESKLNLDDTHCLENVSTWQLCDQWLQSNVHWESDADMNLWIMPFRTVSRHEGDEMESIFQQSTILLHRSIRLEPGQKYFCAMHWKLEDTVEAGLRACLYEPRA